MELHDGISDEGDGNILCRSDGHRTKTFVDQTCNLFERPSHVKEEIEILQSDRHTFKLLIIGDATEIAFPFGPQGCLFQHILIYSLG